MSGSRCGLSRSVLECPCPVGEVIPEYYHTGSRKLSNVHYEKVMALVPDHDVDNDPFEGLRISKQPTLIAGREMGDCERDDRHVESPANDVDEEELHALLSRVAGSRFLKRPAPVPEETVAYRRQKCQRHRLPERPAQELEHGVQNNEIYGSAGSADYGKLHELPDAMVLSQRR